MNPRVHFAIHCVIGIAALAMLGYAFSDPLATLSMNENNVKVSDEIYITQECLSMSAPGLGNQKQCGDLDQVFKSQMQAIMAVVIALMVCIFLEFIGMNFGTMVCYVFGLLVLGLSIALIALVATLPNYHRGSMNYKLTNTSIGVLVVASLLVLFELCCNKLVHRVVLAPYRLVAGKKA